MNIINLDKNVIKALEFFTKNKPPKLNLNKFKFPFVIGSEGAYYTGRNLFSNQAALFANESNFKTKVKTYSNLIKNKTIQEAVIISASGEKDSVWETALANKLGLKTTLLTCEPNSSAAQIANQVLSYKKISEPYSYNFSTYVGMMMSATNEDPKKILNLIKKIKLPKNFKDYKAYSFIIPDEFIEICPMIETKGQEMFGSRMIIRAYTPGRARHAKFVVRWDKELVISLGGKNKHFGDPKARLDIKTPSNLNIAGILSLTYYLVGKVQKNKPKYFQQNIKNYCSDYGPKAYGKNKPFDVIVPGS